MNYPGFSYQIFLVLLVLVVIVGLILYFINPKLKKTKDVSHPSKTSPMDDPNIINRFSRLREQWYKISMDRKFRELANNLGDINSEIVYTNIGSKDILDAYTMLNQYIKSMNMDRDIRITLIYTDGIVYFDSALPINRVYFLQNGLPRPVSMSTLGSPLKNHNVVPEMNNAITIHNSSKPLTMLGYSLNNPLYKTLIDEGFGFFERISSSLNVPYSYMAKFLPIPSGNGSNTFFLDRVILRVGIPIDDNFFSS